IQGDPGIVLPGWLEKNNASHLITDFDPLRIKRSWQDKVYENSDVEFHIVDAHNIIPCWVTSVKQEYAARTIRTKIHKKLDEFLEPFPEIKPLDQIHDNSDFDVSTLLKNLNLDSSVPPVDWIKPGWDQALTVLDNFIDHGLKDYQQKRNDPNANALSNLSPYLHFGQICSQNVALRLKQNRSISVEDADSFLEELIVRKELSDNFCWFNNNYDNFQGLSDWGKKTLEKHRSDTREYMYSLEKFEKGQTHDPLWNACQQEMMITGKMHGYMRMYWAKKILEWTESPEQAIEFALYLNDKYELDGRDPNGCTGVMWSMGGLHDRPWKERPIFGTVRYMNYNGCKRKFNVDQYIQKWTAPGR
ncbi:MAG: deoxyribodipyrimidine photo-lyase, partial [Desulfonatronovibrio sp.]